MTFSSKILNNSPELKNKIIEIISQASSAIMEIYTKTDLGINLKKDNSPVTEADLKANKIICKNLKALFPEVPIISEEESNSFADFQSSKMFWIIDPLDGTKEFINHKKEFTCNIALVEEGNPSFGFVSIPAKNLIYFGGKAYGSYLVNSDGKKSKINCKNYHSTIRIVASKSHLNESTKTFINSIKEPYELVQAGSSLKFIKIAEGKADLYPRLAPTCEWDTAAAQAILEGAGGSVKKINGEDLKYGKVDVLNPYFVAKSNFINF